MKTSTLEGSFDGTLKGDPITEPYIVAARKLEHNYPHALKVNYKES